MENYYLIIKSLHIISFTAWMAGMFYLPRIFVYHSEKDLDVNTYEKFLVMERKLIKIIMTPSMVITWILGILLLLTNDYYILELWMQIKMLLVLLMSATHGYYVSCYKKFLLRKNNRDHKFFRVINEVPTLLFICIVFFVVLKPTF